MFRYSVGFRILRTEKFRTVSMITVLNSNITNVANASGVINVYVDNDGKLHFVNKDGADSVLNFSTGYKGIFKNVYYYYHEASSSDDARIRITNVDTGKYITYRGLGTTIFEDVHLSYSDQAFHIRPLDSSKTMVRQENASSGLLIGSVDDSWRNFTTMRFSMVNSTGFLFDRL